MRFAYQVVAVGSARTTVCSEGCREALLRASTPPTPKLKPAPRVIAVLNQKGGTGKTTSSVSVAAGLAERGKNTLLVDLDAQGSVGVSLGVRGSTSLYHVLVDGVSPTDVTVPIRQGLDVLPSDQSVASAEISLVNAPDRARVLSRRFEALTKPGSPYDFILLDCAPSLSLLNQNALVLAQDVLIPVSCDYLALVGVQQILQTLKHVHDTLLHSVEVLGVLPTFFDVRNRISKEAVAALRSYFKGKVLPPIRVNARLKEAPSRKKTIFEYAPRSHGAEDYARAVDWILQSKDRAKEPMPQTNKPPHVAMGKAPSSSPAPAPGMFIH